MTHPAQVRPRLAVLLSGGGRTLQNLLDRIDDGRFTAEIAGVGSDKADAYGLVRARNAGLDARCVNEPSALWSWVSELGVDLVVLGGYLKLLPLEPEFLGRVLNIHPALLPKHGGKGMFGKRVHEAVLASGDTESGCTVHLCTAEYDRGRVLMQARVPVLPADTPDTLAARVFAAECETYPAAIAMRWRELQS